MSDKYSDYLNSDELRVLTKHVVSALQIDALSIMGVPFKLDQYLCPLVLYKDAKKYFLLGGEPLPRGLSYAG